MTAKYYLKEKCENCENRVKNKSFSFPIDENGNDKCKCGFVFRFYNKDGKIFKELKTKQGFIRRGDVTEIFLLLKEHFGKMNINIFLKTYPNLIEVVEE